MELKKNTTIKSYMKNNEQGFYCKWKGSREWSDHVLPKIVNKKFAVVFACNTP